MASRRSKSSGKGAVEGRAAKGKAKKEPRQKKAKVRTIEAEGEDDGESAPGMSVEDGIVYTTTFLLIGAIVLAFMAMSAFPAVN
mgnify:CR=1 FL=1